MPLWEIDFSDIDCEAEIPEDIDDDEELPEGYNEEFEKVDNFVADNLLRAKETKDVAMIGFIVEQGILRYTRLGLKKEVLDKQIWITQQLGKGILQNFQAEAKGAELKTQIAYVQEMIGDQKKKELELRNRVALLRAERDFKKSRLDAVVRSNHGLMNEVSHINKRRALIQERLRLDTIEYEQEKARREDLRVTFEAYSKELDSQLENAPWLVEKQKKAAHRKELEDEIKSLETDMAKLDLIEERNRIAEESERDLPLRQFCVQLAELYLKREKLYKQLQDEKMNVRKLEEARRARRAMDENSQMDCTQALLDGDLDDEETLMKMAKHYKIDTQNLNAPISQATQQSQISQPVCRKRAQSPAESTASSEANDNDMSDGGENLSAPPPKRVSIVEPNHSPDESVDEGLVHTDAQKEADESQMEEGDQLGDRSQPEQMETQEREEEEEEVEERDGEEEEQEEPEEPEEQEEQEPMEQQQQEESQASQESQATVASQESVMGEVVEQEEAEENDGFLRPSLIPVKAAAPVPAEENAEFAENAEAETSFNPEMMLDISAHSNDPGGDFFDMMNNAATSKRAAVDAAGSSPNPAAAGDGDFMSMFGGGGDGAAADGDAASFSFNFGGGDGNDTNGGGGGGEFNFFGF